MKDFAVDADAGSSIDIEVRNGFLPQYHSCLHHLSELLCSRHHTQDLGAKVCPHSRGPCRGRQLCGKARLEASETDPQWYRPSSLTELFEILGNNPERRIKLLAGDTGRGRYEERMKGRPVLVMSYIVYLVCFVVVVISTCGVRCCIMYFQGSLIPRLLSADFLYCNWHQLGWSLGTRLLSMPVAMICQKVPQQSIFSLAFS